MNISVRRNDNIYPIFIYLFFCKYLINYRDELNLRGEIDFFIKTIDFFFNFSRNEHIELNNLT